MRKLILALTLLALASVASAQSASPDVHSGRFMATNYGQWTTSVTAVVSGQICVDKQNIVLSDGSRFNPWNTNAPILVGIGASQETVTPTSFSFTQVSGQTCISGTYTKTHVIGDIVSSGTFGLQEALNSAGIKGGGAVTIDQNWSALGGTTAIKNAASVPANTGIEDIRSGPSAGSGTVTNITCGTGITGTCPLTSSGTISLSTPVSVANGGSGASTLTGVIKGNGTSPFTIAGSADIIAMFSACSGTQYLGADGACHTAGAGSFPSGNGIAGEIVSGTPVISQTFLPTIDVRLYFTTAYPTYSQAQSQDIGAVINAALTAATPTGECVDLSGLNLLNAPNIAVYYATTNPFAGLLSNTYVPCLLNGNFTIVTGATWATPGGSIKIIGYAPGGIGGTGLVLQPCNTNPTCNGSGGLTVNQFPNPATCAASGGLNCYPVGITTSGGALTQCPTGSTCAGTVTYTTGSKTVTGSGTNWTSALVGGAFVSSCGAASLATCPVGSTSLYTTGRIVAVGSATSLTLDATYAGNVASGTAGQNYVVWLPNDSVVWCAACLGNNLQKSFTGQEVDNLDIDLNGIGGIGYLAKGAQEGSVLNNFACSLQSGSPAAPTAGGTCLVWDQSVRESGATSGTTANGTFLGHFSVHDGRMGVGANAGGANAFGAVIEGFDKMSGSVSSSQANGPSEWTFQAIIGGAASARFQDAVQIDAITGMHAVGTHIENVANDDWNIGPNNPTYNVNIQSSTSSGTLGNCVVEFHSGSTGNQAHGISRPSGGCLAQDDNLPSPTIATSTGGTPNSWTLPVYVQSANGNGLITSGSVQSLSDGTHAGILSLTGNTTVPSSLPSNSFGWIGPNSAAFTSYFLQPSSTAPAASGPLLVGTTVSNVSPVSYGTITGNTTAFATTSGALVSGNCVKSDANHNLIDSGGTCGGSGTNINTFTSQVNVGSNFGMGTPGQTNCNAQWLPAPGTFNNVGIDVTTLDATNTYEFGIYTGNAGGTATLQCHTTAATLPATGFKAIALSTSCSLPAGRIYLCFGQSGGAATAQIAEGYGIDVLLTETNSIVASFFPGTFTAPADSAAASQINHASGGFKGIIFDLLP